MSPPAATLLRSAVTLGRNQSGMDHTKATAGNKCFIEHDAALDDFQCVNSLRPRPEERALARVSKDGQDEV
jgi:hypothetical protein